MRRASTNPLAILLIPLHRWRPSDHIAAVAWVVGDLALELENLVLHARNAQLVLVLHATEALLDATNVRPYVALTWRLLLAYGSGGQNIPHAAAGRAAVAGHASRVRA
jgi:hypothetical protein